MDKGLYTAPECEIVVGEECDVISTSDIIMPPHIFGKSSGTDEL